MRSNVGKKVRQSTRFNGRSGSRAGLMSLALFTRCLSKIKDSGKKHVETTLKNNKITASEIFLIKENGTAVGLANLKKVLQSKEKSMDLVQVSLKSPAGSSIPTVREFSRNLPIVKKEPVKRPKIVEVHTCIDDHDLTIKIGKMETFLTHGKKVRVEISRKTTGPVKLLNRKLRSAKEISQIVIKGLDSFKSKIELDTFNQVCLLIFPNNSSKTNI